MTTLLLFSFPSSSTPKLRERESKIRNKENKDPLAIALYILGLELEGTFFPIATQSRKERTKEYPRLLSSLNE